MKGFDLRDRIASELRANDPEFARSFHSIAALIETLREKGFSGPEAHLLAAGPGLLREAQAALGAEPIDVPYMTIEVVAELHAAVVALTMKCKRGGLAAEARHLEIVADYLTERMRLLRRAATSRLD